MRKPRAFAPDDPALGAEPPAGARSARRIRARDAARQTRARRSPTRRAASAGARCCCRRSAVLGALDHALVRALRRGGAGAPGLGRLARLRLSRRRFRRHRADPARAHRPLSLGPPRRAACRQRGAEATATWSASAGRCTTRRLLAGRADLAWPLAPLQRARAAVLEPGDLLALADRELMVPLDQEARRTVARPSASPWWRRSARWPGSPCSTCCREPAHAARDRRPLRRAAGPLGALRLGRMVVGHIIATGGVALTDDLLGQFLGQDLLRRLSRRLGEGAFNGALTARVGAAAVDVCRPLPFIAAPPIRARATCWARCSSRCFHPERHNRRN